MHQACVLGTIAGSRGKMVAKHNFCPLGIYTLMEETHSKQRQKQHLVARKSSKGEVEGAIVRGLYGMDVKS